MDGFKASFIESGSEQVLGNLSRKNERKEEIVVRNG